MEKIVGVHTANDFHKTLGRLSPLKDELNGHPPVSPRLSAGSISRSIQFLLRRATHCSRVVPGIQASLLECL